ncbi:MAG TPA: phosphoglucosamine mutase [Dongiaceae bacterium]|nr:phosphoglucosamine mutase [Dongiaceae bacterium]
MQARVVAEGADLGLALDGDADRLLVADERGALLDGDQLLALVARSWSAAGRLAGGGVVATVMSNLGLERYLGGLGLGLARTPVGDRYVVERMRADGFNVGGEQSGHLILGDYATTGDGLIAALQVLAVLVQSGRPASEAGRLFAPLPQRLKSLRVNGGAALDDARGRYIEFVKNGFPKGLNLDGLKVVVDCANGAAYRVAPTVLWELGAEVVSLGVEPDGVNINRDCGAVAPAAMQARVVAEGADLGLALDGDADRLLVADERGALLDGDQLLALVARSWSAAGRLAGGGVVATVMSNLGLERYLGGLGLKLARTPVGDRYVVERMRAGGFNVGGEQSGHLILSDYATTGDGLIAALQVLAVLVQSGRPASEAGRLFAPLPQRLKSLRINGGAALDDARVRDAIRAGEAALGASGRLLVRKSGTEPVIRIMAEGEDDSLVGRVIDDVAAAIAAAAR